jgi:hypothetical protein
MKPDASKYWLLPKNAKNHLYASFFQNLFPVVIHQDPCQQEKRWGGDEEVRGRGEVTGGEGVVSTAYGIDTLREGWGEKWKEQRKGRDYPIASNLQAKLRLWLTPDSRPMSSSQWKFSLIGLLRWVPVY